MFIFDEYINLFMIDTQPKALDRERFFFNKSTKPHDVQMSSNQCEVIFETFCTECQILQFVVASHKFCCTTFYLVSLLSTHSQYNRLLQFLDIRECGKQMGLHDFSRTFQSIFKNSMLIKFFQKYISLFGTYS